MKFYTRFPLYAEATEAGSPGATGGDPMADASQRTGDIKLGGEGPKAAESQAGAAPAAEVKLAPAAAADPTKAVAAAAAETAKGWTFENFMKNMGADFKEGDPRLSDFKAVKGFTEKVVKTNETLALKEIELSTKVAGLEKQLQEAMAKPGGAAPADIVAIKTQLEETNAKYTAAQAKLNDFEAKGKLEGHPEFKREFDERQAAVFRNAKATAEAVGVKQEQLDDVFKARGELAITKAVKALGDIDPDAAGIIKARALEWDGLQTTRDELLAGKTGRTPSQLLAEYEGRNSEYGVQLAGQFAKELTGKLILSTEGAAEKLAADHPMFGTEHGKMLAEGLKLQFQSGHIPNADEVVKNTLLAKVTPMLQKLYLEEKAKTETLQAQVTKLTGHLPKGDTATGETQSSNRMVTNGYVDPTQRQGDIVLGKTR